MAVENPEENIRDAALRLHMEEEKRRKTDPNESHERSLIIIGSKSVMLQRKNVTELLHYSKKTLGVQRGKTTMLYRFLERDETPKPTIAIDYSFGRKAGKSLVKNIMHVWEVGQLIPSLVSAALAGASLTHSPHHITVLIMLDLAKPDMLWSSLEGALSVMQSRLKMNYDNNMIQELKDRRIKERKKSLERGVDPFPIRLCFIGGKYDEFKELDLNIKEEVGRMLRAVAHTLGAGLHYHSSKDKTLVRKSKDLLSHYGFGTQVAEGKCTDFEKPLSISPGLDSYSQIDLQLSQIKPSEILTTIKQIYISHIPQISRKDEIPVEDPSNDPNFNEPIIDRLRAQREEEIDVLLSDMLEGQTAQILIPDPV